ncbi:MAG TPA: hypothetical protein VHZ24_16540 [Pirellulales bacterium]|jgi:hypothetical protein|nr:hypothetical protein [Pirellulales bacterium]
MALADKVIAALRQPLDAAYIRLDNDDGISGIVVSKKFEGMTMLDRQTRIDELLSQESSAITPQEQRQVLMIAGLTPAEYEAAGARVRIQKVAQSARGEFEIRVHGGWSDAEYVRGALNNQKGVRTTEPEQVTDASGVLMSFRAEGSPANPLTKHGIVSVLGSDPHIQVPRGE